MRGAVARLRVEFVMIGLPSDNYIAVPILTLNIWDLPLRQGNSANLPDYRRVEMD